MSALRTTGVDTLVLLLLLMAHGWGIIMEERKPPSAVLLIAWTVLTLLDHIFFLCNIVSTAYFSKGVLLELFIVAEISQLATKLL